MKKKIRFKKLFHMTGAVLLAAAMLCVSGCNRKDNGGSEESTVSEENAVVYQPSYSEFEYKLDADKYDIIPSKAFYYLFVNDNAVYGILGSYNQGKKINEQYLVTQNMQTGEYTNECIGAWKTFFQTSNGFVGYANKTLYIYDDKFAYQKEISLDAASNELTNAGSGLSVNAVEFDANGNICIMCPDVLIYMDENGSVLGIIDKPSEVAGTSETGFAALTVTGNGEWYMTCADQSYMAQVYKIDLDNRTISEKLVNTPKLMSYDMKAVRDLGDGALAMITGDNIYRYDTVTTEYTSLVCLRDYGLSMTGYTGEDAAGVSQTGSFYVVLVTDIEMADGDSNEATVSVELAEMNGVQGGYENRKELVMSAFTTPAYYYTDPIDKFNRYNKDYYITIKSYYNYGEDEYDTALTNFYNDLITGRGADIFWFEYDDMGNIENLAEKGVIADLYPYLDADNDMKREDFIPSVLSAMETDGKLYSLSPEFELATIAGKADILGAYEDWNFTSMYEMIKEHEGAQPFVGCSKNTVLKGFLSMSMDKFYDKNTGECSFNSDEFINMLNVVQAQTEDYYDIDEVYSKFANDEILMVCPGNLDAMQIRMVEAYFGNDEVMYAGYPSKEQSAATISTRHSMAMSELGDNKEAAWEFIKFYLNNYISINDAYTSVFADKFDDVLEKQQLLNGGVTEGDPLNSALSAEEAQHLRELVYNAKGYKQNDSEIYNIVYEEAQNFLNGQRSAQDTADIVQNRVQLYLDEQD